MSNTLISEADPKRQPCAIDREEARRHLDALLGRDSTNEIFVFAVIDDDKGRDGGAPSHPCGTLDECIDELSGWNIKGYGIFVTVNETAGPGTGANGAPKDKDVTSFRAHFIDLDGGHQAVQPRLQAAADWTLAPHFFVVTGNGAHSYWRIKDDGSSAGDFREEFRDRQRRLNYVLDADPRIFDPRRVMRLAGSWHMKGEPYLCRCKVLEEHGAYAASEFDTALAGVHVPISSGKKRDPQGATYPEGAVWRAVMWRREDWVPAVLPCRLGAPDAGWRISSNELGRDLEEDLCLFPDGGIKDFGTERPHTPISLIMEFGRVDRDGSIEFGGCPEYGEGEDGPYSVVGELDDTIRRPTDGETLAWLTKTLGGRAAPVDAPRADHVVALAAAVGIDWDVLVSDYIGSFFDILDDAGDPVEDSARSPEQWTREVLQRQRHQLPAMQARHPARFNDYVATWIDFDDTTAEDVQLLIDAERERVREAFRTPHLPERPKNSTGAIEATPFELREPSSIPERKWLYGRYLIRGYTSVTLAPGGVGKSSLAITEGLAMATGRNLTGDKPEGKLRVWIWNGEDPREEIERRIAAARLHYEIAADDMADRLFVNSGRDMEISIAAETNGGTKVAVPVVDALIRTIRANRIDVVIIDPFVSSHRVSENDNNAIDAVIKQGWNRVAGATGCAIELVHHTRKTGGAEITVEDGRGGSSLIGAVRNARTLNRMTKDEGDKAGIENHNRYFRVHNGKPNMTVMLPAAKARWYYLESIHLGNGPYGTAGDSIGVVVPWSWPDASAGIADDDRCAVWRAIGDGEWRESPQAKAWVGKPIAEVLGLDLDSKSHKERIKDLIKEWVKGEYLKSVERKDAVTRHARAFIELGEAALSALNNESDEQVGGQNV